MQFIFFLKSHRCDCFVGRFCDWFAALRNTPIATQEQNNKIAPIRLMEKQCHTI